MTNEDQLPEFVDILLEVLNDQHAEETSQMAQNGIPPKDIRRFVEKNLRRYSTRIYFQNRHGYRRRLPKK